MRTVFYRFFEGEYCSGDKALEGEINLILLEKWKPGTLLTKFAHHQSAETLITAEMRGRTGFKGLL